MFYQQNLRNVQSIFTTYLQNGKEPVATLKKLKDAINENNFITIIQQAGTRTNLSTIFGTATLTHLEKNLLVLKTVAAQTKFVEMMNAYESDRTKVPINTLGVTLDLLKALRTALSANLIKGGNFLEDVLPLITPVVNQTIGQNISYPNLLLLTQSGGVMEHNAIKGSIFEHWGMKQHNTVEYARLNTYVLGNALIRKNPKGLPSIIVDFHYLIPTTSINQQVVAVEFKHAKEVPAEQLTKRALVFNNGQGVIARFIYVFAEKPVADPKFPNDLSRSPVVLEVRRVLGGGTEIYYYVPANNGSLEKI